MQEQQDPLLNVDSIHYEAIARIKVILDQVKDHRTRTLILYGDSGSGKAIYSAQTNLNPKAFYLHWSLA